MQLVGDYDLGYNHGLQIGDISGDIKLGNLHRKLKIEGAVMSTERRMGILEQEMHGARKGIPKIETYNPYGDDAKR